jgi:hypothetical protein
MPLVVSALITSISIGAFSSARLRAEDVPETVMVTLHAKPGAEAELARVLERHWETVRRLDLVLPATHVTLRGTDGGNRTYFVDIFTWRTAEIPDHAPAEILAIWKDMNALVEPRGGKPGLSITEVSIVAPNR